MGVIFSMSPGRWELYSLFYQVDGSYILYTNAVLDSKTLTGGIRFFESIKIPFQCRLAINSTLSQGLKPVANRLLMRIENTGYLQER